VCRRWSKGSSTSTSSERRLNPFWCSGADTDMETTTNEHGPRQICTALTTDEAPVWGQVQDIQNWPQTLWVWPFTRRAWLLRAWARMRQRAQLDPAPPPPNPTRAFDFCAATFAARPPAARGERSAFSPGVIGRPNEACRTARNQLARDAGQAGGTARRRRGTAQIESAAACQQKGGGSAACGVGGSKGQCSAILSSRCPPGTRRQKRAESAPARRSPSRASVRARSSPGRCSLWFADTSALTAHTAPKTLKFKGKDDEGGGRRHQQ
jgi:hypothetical protein